MPEDFHLSCLIYLGSISLWESKSLSSLIAFYISPTLIIKSNSTFLIAAHISITTALKWSALKQQSGVASFQVVWLSTCLCYGAPCHFCSRMTLSTSLAKWAQVSPSPESPASHSRSEAPLSHSPCQLDRLKSTKWNCSWKEIGHQPSQL